ncbi:hypothetical protein GCM10008171_02310 [Methylopila jiangsuensis]|uniref:Uncharacterized protein n=1 Tax=Methylopila jiangsuensis TaxID=586230 RepID=A0A9W6JDF7_9HYPH|nr:hypothetical protein GCM10008171_02310 [Methylopila jiangsuensis]
MRESAWFAAWRDIDLDLALFSEPASHEAIWERRFGCERPERDFRLRGADFACNQGEIGATAELSAPDEFDEGFSESCGGG